MTEDEAVELGTRAEFILRDESFNLLYQLITSQLSLDILATAPDAGKLRSELYFTYHGMRSFSDRLTGLVLAKEQIIAKQNEDSNPESD